MIDTEWHETELESIGKIVTGKTPSTARSEFFGGDIPFITPTDMNGRRIISETERYLSENGKDAVAKVIVPTGAILVSCIGSDMGKSAIAGRDSVTNQQINSVIVAEPNSALFVYYNLSNRRDELRSMAAGSAQPILNKSTFARLRLRLPSPNKQHAIAEVLGSLDDKIEQNRRTGSKLEGLARAVFKAWFVDFEPVKAKAAGATAFPGMPPETFATLPTRFQDSTLGPVPEGWQVRSLYSTAKFINGAAFKNSHFCDSSSGIPVVKIAELKSGITEQTKYSSRTDLDARYRIDTGEILYSWSGSPDTSLDTFIWTKGPGLLNQHIFRVVTESEPQKVFVYYLLKHLKKDLIEIARNKQTTGLGHVTVGDMERLMVACPDANALNGFWELIGPIFAIAFNGLLESEKLAALRDYLLPRLLSGRVRVGKRTGKGPCDRETDAR